MTAIGIAEALTENREKLAAAMDVGTDTSKPQHVTQIEEDEEPQPSEQRKKTQKRDRTGSPEERRREGTRERYHKTSMKRSEAWLSCEFDILALAISKNQKGDGAIT